MKAPTDAAVGSRRAQALLGVGAAIGLAMALAGGVADGSGGRAPVPGSVASVNDVPISREAYQRAVAALASDRRDPLDEEDRRFVLQRLVDEELLVQRGLELGLARHDRRVRANLVSAVMDGVVAEAEEAPATPQALQRFYAEHREWFTQPGRLRVRRLWVADRGEPEAAEARASEAVKRLRAGDAFEEVADALGDPAVAELPDVLLPATKLREYVGPTALRRLGEVEPGGVAGPLRSGGGYQVLWLRAREPSRVPPLEEIRPAVAAEWRRRDGEKALRRYLEGLRARAQVQISETLP